MSAQTDLINEITTQLPTNGVGLISASILRGVLDDMVNTIYGSIPLPGPGTDPLALTQGLSISATNPTIGGDANFRRGADINVTFNELNSNIGFTGQTALNVDLQFDHGLNVYAGGTNAKFTPRALNVGGDFIGSGQKCVQTWGGNFYSMGDSAVFSGAMTYSGGPIWGDEGQGFSPNMTCGQPGSLCRATISAVTRTACNTTTTGIVTGSQTAQNIPVASTVGANVGDWVVLNQQLPSGAPNIAVMKILSINPGVSINGVCPINMGIGAKIKPALCLTVNSTYQWGQDRVVVNLSGMSYSTGTVSGIVGGAFNGNLTNWSNGMVGGDADNIGCIYLNADTYRDGPYAGYVSPDGLRSYYQITGVTPPASLGILSFSSAGDQAYHGNGPGDGSYVVLPAARVLHVNPVGSSYNVICEYSAHTWSVGHTVECAICPYPDVHGWWWSIGQYTAGGVRRSALNLSNAGARMFASAIDVNASGGTIGNVGSDAVAYDSGINISSINYGVKVAGAVQAAIGINNFDYATNPNGGKVKWITTDCWLTTKADGFMQWQSGPNSILEFLASSDPAPYNRPWVHYNGGGLELIPSAGFPRIRMNRDAGGADQSFDISYYYPYSPLTNGTALHFTFNDVTGGKVLLPFAIGAPSDVFHPACGIGPTTNSTSNVTNVPSAGFMQSASVWNGSSAVSRYTVCRADPAQGIDNAKLSWSVLLQYAGDAYDTSFPNKSLSVREDGIISFGSYQINLTDKRLSLDPSALTAARTASFPDATGAALVHDASGAPATAASSGSPGEIRTDGTWLYICTAANTWLRSACATW